MPPVIPLVPLGRRATLADLEALPSHVKGEILDGVLYTQARPRPLHQHILGLVHDDLCGPFQRGREGPGGWWILSEPGIELPGSPEFAPDLAGWRRNRLPTLPVDGSFALTPDWVCEILSPSNRGYDLVTKRRFYARIEVPYIWYVDPEARVLFASQLQRGQWVELGTYESHETPHVAPFDAIPLDLAGWWPLRRNRQ